MSDKIQVLDGSDLTPRCPHCNSEISNVLGKKLTATMGRRYVYFCERCLKVLGVSHRKGFWMG